MGRFVGLTKNKGSGLAIEDPDFENAGLILTSTGTGFVLAGGASLNRDPLPDYINANESLSETLSVTGAFGDSTYTFAWRDGAQYGLSLSSGGSLTGSASSMDETSILKIDITDTKYDVEYEVDITIYVSSSNTYPAITTNPTSSVTLTGTETFQYTYSGTPTEWAIVSRGNLPANVTISSGGLMTWPGKSSDESNTTYNFTLGVRNAAMPANNYRTVAFNKAFYFEAVKGQQQYEGAYGQNGGTCVFTWVAPTGVTSVNVLAIGAGGSGRYDWAACGGHGGGSVWANNIPVTPGSSYTVRVGRGACWSNGPNCGGCSCWPGMNACGGCCGCYGGCYYIGNVNGGSGTCCGSYGMVAYPSTAGGGGGAAGYSSGGNASSNTSGYRGCGGGGGGATSYHSSTHGTGGGGGTGSCGKCCYANGGPYGQSCGKCGHGRTGHGTSGGAGQGGSGGSCGNPGEPYSNGRGNGYNCGGIFGGGAGGGGTSSGGGWGGPGVVRIIWGQGRSWPCTNTHNL